MTKIELYYFENLVEDAGGLQRLQHWQMIDLEKKALELAARHELMIDELKGV